jgi:hypothetical protein
MLWEARGRRAVIGWCLESGNLEPTNSARTRCNQDREVHDGTHDEPKEKKNSSIR